VSLVNLRRTFALGTAGLAATLMLTACGFNYPTDRINNLTSGVNDRSGTVDVLNAAIVSKKDGQGTFIAGFANQDISKAVKVTGMNGNQSVTQVSFKPFTIKPNGFVNLASKGGIPMFGTFKLGQFVGVTINYDNGETSSLSVPVVDDSGQWAGLDIATPSPTSSPTAPASPASGSKAPKATGSPASPTASGS
jgi:hypothetical protein